VRFDASIDVTTHTHERAKLPTAVPTAIRPGTSFIPPVGTQAEPCESSFRLRDAVSFWEVGNPVDDLPQLNQVCHQRKRDSELRPEVAPPGGAGGLAEETIIASSGGTTRRRVCPSRALFSRVLGALIFRQNGTQRPRLPSLADPWQDYGGN
jgi:hypothetical protein